MRLELVHRGEHTVHLRLRGDIDETAAASLGDNIARFAAADRHVEIDCSAMGYLDASGLTVLLQLRYERSLAGGRLTLDNLPPAVSEVSSSLRRPPTISWVGTIEPFKDETIAYMGRLDTAGVPTSFKLYEGGFHGFEHLLPKADVSQDPIEFEGSAFAEFYDRYL